MSDEAATGDRTGTEIAILGMAGRFPGASDLEQLWQNLRDGVEAISSFSADEILAEGVPPEVLARPGFVRAGAFLAGADLFDAAFFDYAPREAEVIDPQQRLLLEVSWEALERAGHAGTSRPVGVFAGTSSNTYIANVLSHPEIRRSVGFMALGVASDRDFIATRISYKLNLTGPSFTVQTACSTSLVAVHLACQSLLAGECELALAGAASVWSPRKSGYVCEPGGILSPDGHCRAFDAAAAGTVMGQGVGVVVLKLLDEALADGDTILAVIRGSGVNNDGADKSGFTAPSEEGQARVIRLAQRQAGVAPDSIGYVEAHGSATPMGDPIEVAALTRAFRLGTRRRSFCALGSIKTNIGHLDAAAGVAGLIKTVLALEKKEIPPSLHFAAPNPQIDFAASPFYVNARLTEWRTDRTGGGPRRAGVSSFGLGGTNAHVVLEEAPPAEPSGPARSRQLLVLSARSSAALERATDDLAAHLRLLPDPSPSRFAHFADIAWTLQAGRRAFRHRRTLMAASAEEAAEALAGRDPRRLRTTESAAGRSVAFLLPGVGDHYPGMARGLYREEPAFRREIDRCADLLLPLLDLDLREALFAGREEPEAGGATGPDLRALVRRPAPAPSSLLHQTRIAQPAVFAVGYALARLWMGWGIRPQALLGYSLGEYTAACLAGVLSLADALTLVARRAALIEALPPGAMTAVPLAEEEARRRLTPGLSLAAVNAPEVSVVAGEPGELAALERRLAEEGLPCRRLPTSHAFHSRMMEPAAAAFSDLLRTVRLAPPEIPYLSNLTGTWIEPAEATDPAYWVRHLLGTVRFADAVGELWAEPGRVLLEAGPGPALGSLALQHPASAGGLVLSSLPHELDRRDDAEHLQDTLGQLWLAGAEPDWTAFHAGERRRRVPLPTYPFEQRSYWIPARTAGAASPATPRPGKLPDPADWFHIPFWKPAPLLRAAVDAGNRWLLLLDGLGVGLRLAERLREGGCEVDAVLPGNEAALAAALAARPSHVVHLACLTPGREGLPLAEAQDLGFHCLLALARELGQSPEDRVALHIVANGLCRVERRDPLHPEKALLLGPLRVIPQELGHIACRAVDVDPADLDEGAIERLCAELRVRDGEPLVAWRGDQRWVAGFEPVRLPVCEGTPAFLREGGVYLITGGLGGIGLALAGHLARTVRARLALVGRSARPDRSGGPPHVEEALREIEAAGAEVLVLRADVADEVQMRAAVERVRARFGRLDGVFHAAGVPGGGLIHLKTREAAEAVLAPKVAGARVLASVLGDEPPDFLVLFSSINAITGGIGQVDYCAANAFLGALAEQRGAIRTIAIDWCEWEWDAWTFSWLHDPALREELKRQRLTYGLRFAEGMEALSRVLASGLPRVVVSTRSLPAVLAQRQSLDALLAELEHAQATVRGEHDRPALTTAYVAPESAAERRLAEIWQSVLGVRQIGVHDNFFELGGHSLLGLQLLSRIRRELGAELPLRALFETPTVAGLAAALDASPGAAGAPTGEEIGRIGEIEPVAPETLHPLSFSQQRLWFIDQLEPGSAAYHVGTMLEVAGGVDSSLLAAALREIVRRHQTLRTTFAMSEDGQPVQIVAPAGEPGFLVCDLQALPAPREGREAAARRAGQAFANDPFDLGRGPLLRACLLLLAPGESLLVLAMHHIVSDAWSLGLLVRELGTLYQAFAAGRPSPLPELPLQYADFATWQRRWLRGEVLERETAWWKARLAGAPAALELPADRSRPAVQSYRGGSVPLAWPAALHEAVAALARREGATPFMVLLAAFQALLLRTTGQEDVCVGAPVAGRGREELERLIGLFANVLVLRCDLSGDPPFRGLLAQVREVVLGAFEHQDMPVEKLLDALQPVRDPSRPPLFQVVLALQNTPEEPVELSALTLAPLAAERTSAKFDLSLEVLDLASGLRGLAEYNRDLFDRSTVLRLIDRFERLLAGAAAAPETPVGRLPLLPEREQHQVLAEWNDTHQAWPGEHTLGELFERQARRTPEAFAACFAGESWTYRELAARAARLARHLRREGVGPDVRVAVCLERSLDLVAALLAVVQAGGAYVPIDPEYPQERRALLLEDCRAAVLLTEERWLAGLPPHAARTVLLDRDRERIAAETAATPEAVASLDSLAYVIYTSGSTGLPKGAMVHHRGIHNRLLWMQEAYGLGPADTVLQKTPFSFDVSVWEFFWPLSTGARLVLARPGGHRDGAYLAELIAGQRVTVLHFVPSMLQAFLEEPDLSGCRSLRLVVASGEALSPELARRFHERLPWARLENLYGPTEASVDVTSWSCRPGEMRSTMPIGRPIANTRIHLLDRDLAPVPIGVAGELWIGGTNVGRGYLDRPGLTAERFVPDPFPVSSTGPGARLYRTGDLARLRADGAIEFLGRLDHQVKLRGFRIELGEIEAVLASHPAVRECAVLAREDAPGERRLAAYVVLHPTDPTDPTDPSDLRSTLAAFLAERLPAHMVPAFFVPLAALPLNPNGKLDRRALPAPERTSGARSSVAPRGPIEQAIAEIWSGLLKIDSLGIDDSFFALGGDSIQAVRLVSRLNARLGGDLRVQDVFTHQSIAGLAERLSRRAGRSVADDHAAGLAEIERLQRAVLADERQRSRLPADHEDFFPMSGIEKGMVYYTLLLPDQPIYHDQYAYLLAIDDVEAFFRAFELLVDRHPILRSTWHLDDFAEPMKVLHPAAPVAREIEDVSALSPDEQGRRLAAYRLEDLRHRFTFAGELLWRLRLFKLGSGHFCAVWTWHHALLEGWSNISLWAELSELYARPDLREIRRLPPLASSYKDYLAITLGRGRSPATEAFWRETLAGAGRNRLPFSRPVDRTRPAFGMEAVDRPLASELLDRLRARATRLGAPLKAVCLAAHVHLLHATAGEPEVITGVVSHDRPGIPDGDRIIGCFLNTVPVRLRIRPGESGGALVRRVSRFLAVEKEHEIPLVDIAAVAGARATAENPFFDTLLNFMDYHLVEEMPGSGLLLPDAARDSQALDLGRNEMTNTFFDLEVAATLGHFSVRIKYSPRHFEAADVERAVVLYERILEALGEDREAPLGTEALLAPAEVEQLVHAYNATALAYPRERPLHSFFEERAALHPELPAVFCGGRSLTYGELDRLANRTARFLLARGVEPGDNVGVCLERSPELVVALFGVLKAGAAYVPLEPSYPPARKDWIARQSAISFLLEELPEDLSEDGAAFSDAPVPLRPRPDDLAYTIYTSGSTGTPKGVMIEHHSAVNLIGWVNRQMAVGPGTRVLMLSSVCFDLSVYDIFGTLGAGGEVVVARQEEVQDPAALTRLVFDRGITFWNSVPSTLGLLVQYLEETDPGFRGEELRVAFLSGDWIPLSLPDRARRLFPDLRVVSLGGATEGTVWSIWHPVEAVDEAWQSIPYGRPLDNNTFYVLDRNLELVPPGVVGDLHIGGIGVARGYAGDPEKTAASFVPDPFAGASGARLYRTGDLGRMMPAGEIEFLGRSDHQVKVRGFRVELGEIESQLARHPGVREAVVVARADRSGQRSLCGYVVAAGEVPAGALQEHLSQTLPGYMVPDVFVFLSELPLTPNGKLDRKALPEPEAAGGPGGFVAPAGEIETAVAEIWREVLGVETVGARHDFFALGGHSLSAIQVLTRVRRCFAVDLPLPDFFAEPTVAGLAAAVERLRQTAPAGEETGRSGVIEPVDPGALLPLSFAQQRLWFLHQLEPASPAYNMPFAVRLEGRLEPAVVAASLEEVVRRHAALRTMFVASQGEPAQVIAQVASCCLPLIDLSSLRPAARQAETRRLAQREAASPFDLAQGPLLRTALLRQGAAEHVLLLTLHHIVSDAWSIGVLVEELGTLYAAFSQGQASPLPELDIQYADFAVWQRQWLTEQRLAAEVSWWRQRLSPLPPALELPADRPRPAVQSFDGAVRRLRLPAAALADLHSLSRRQASTLFMSTLSGLEMLLARHSGQEDFAVGTVVAGRDRLQTERLIGFFVNTLVLRAELSGDPSFAEVAGRVREAALQAYAHQDLPFERLVSELQPERDLGRTPLFQVMFALQNAPAPALWAPGLQVGSLEPQSRMAKFDLEVTLREVQGELWGELEYRRDLYEAPAMERLVRRYERLLKEVSIHPQRRLSELALLEESELHQMLVEWGGPETGWPAQRTVVERFEQQAALREPSPAVVFEGAALSYGELNRRANQVAHRLRRLGLATGTPVGLCVERSLELAVGVLGIWKAGGALLPLDPSQPRERLGLLIADSAAGALLSGAGLERRLPQLGLPRVELAAEELSGESGADPEPVSGPLDLAYVIYTSGSTGRPKGVLVEHASLSGVLEASLRELAWKPDDSMLCLAPFTFDIFLFELLSPLLAGGRCVLVPLRPAVDVERVVDLLAESTRMHAVPALMRQVVETARRRRRSWPELRSLFVGGDAVPVDLLAELREVFPQAGVEVLYGPTEATIICARRRLAAGEAAPRRASIGRPLPQAQIRLCDRWGNPVPAGVAGEIWIGGSGVTRGYLGRPELTAEVYVPAAGGQRFYRTGDLAVWSAEGELEFRGRIDQQVKVRGFRIEPGEVESALAGHPGVRASVVLARPGPGGERRLVAWVVGDGEPAPGAGELREFLESRLPDYMVPGVFVALAGLPLTPTGKVDRNALPEPGLGGGGAGRAPAGPVEELVAGIFCELLGVEEVGTADDFFERGGHSLLATRVVSRVREAFGVEVPLRALFEAPTVAELAQRIRQEGREPAAPLVPVSREGDLPLSFAQQRLWFLDRLAPDNPFYNVYSALQLSGPLNVEALQSAFREIVRRHETLRTSFRLAGGRPVQAIDPGPHFQVPLIRLDTLPEEIRQAELTRLSRAEAQRPFDLSRGPLLRAPLIRLQDREHALLINIHHIVSDGWSMGILYRELVTLYDAFTRDEPSPLAELPVQYADFAVWQRDWLCGERLEAQLGYWRRRLAGLSGTLELPCDHPRPAVESFRGSLQTFELPRALVAELKALTRHLNATPSMTVLAGFQSLLARSSGKDDIAVGAAIANRTRREVEGLIGFFVNTLVLRSDLSGRPGLGSLLLRVRNTALEAYDSQDLPFERLVEDLQPERSLGHNPLIQVMFSYQNFPRAAAEVRDLAISPAREGWADSGTAKFDLTLFVFEQGDQLHGMLEYNSELFEAATIRRLLGHFETLLGAAVADPESPLAFLPLLAAGERHQLLVEWGGAGGHRGQPPAAPTLHGCFEAQARRSSESPALICEDASLSYGELNRQSNQLARWLRRHGVGPESRVGLCLERSLDLVVGILGVLKAGGAYVPLDPGYPRERLAYMIEDAGVEVVVGTKDPVAALPDTVRQMVRQILLDAHGELLERLPAGDLEPLADGENLAYVIYTSGSTGRPKGALVSHGNVARLFAATQAWFRFGERDVWTLFHSYAFDFSVWEIWGALLHGGRLVVVPYEVSRSPELFLDLLARERVTVLNQTPSAFAQLAPVDAERRGVSTDLRLVIFGGEALDPASLAPWFARHGDQRPRLVNMYGITETTVHVTFRPLCAADARGDRRSVIGVPIPDLTLAVMDPGLQPVPIGVPGELVIGGAGLARGYLDRPELTAQRFIPDPFGGRSGARLYRSGDLGRFLPNGDLEYLGRIDQQVKVRGFRIELGEIEARLAEHPAVLQSVVIAREDVQGDRRLVAYVLQNPAHELPEDGAQSEQVSQWSEIFDDLYREESAGSDPTFNIIGWNSSYTDLPLPGHEMEDWLEDTVERILALSPRRVLEIGCGTGMILFRVAPGCELYTGTDISGQALEYIDRQLGRLEGVRSRVRLLRRPAEQFEGLEAGSFDTVVLNSVAQYFPSADYLAAVLEQAVDAVRPGGSIFLGDLRSLPLLEVFHASLELFDAKPQMRLPDLRQRVMVRRRHENELVVDPAFFAALQQRLPRIARVEVHPKRGRARNELTGFRYQVVLRIGETTQPEEISWLDWQAEGLTVASLRQFLEENRPEEVGLRNVPNARVAEQAAAARLLFAGEEGIETAGDLLRQAARTAAGAIEPQDLLDLGRELPYEVELGWAAPGSEGRFDAVLRRRGSEGPISALLPQPRAAALPLARFTNNPLQGRFARRIAPELRAFLAERLPDHMVPSSFVLLDAFPLSPNGKVDRRRLPAPDAARPETGKQLVAPRNPTEEKLLEIWKELLGIERIGVDDGFFELGGHSLLATQAVSRVREAFGRELSLRTFFEAPSVAAVAAVLEALRDQEGGTEVPPILPVPRDGRLPLSFAQERLWFLHRLGGRELAYNESAAFRMEGPLDAAALCWSLGELLRRHESLRTTFPEVDGQAVQAIQPPAPFDLLPVDLRALPGELRDEEARRLAGVQALRPFDLARGPLVRGLLVRLADHDHAALFAFHHIVFDGWSIGVFARELSALYGARTAGRPSPLPPLAVQYADFAAWQRRWLRDEVLELQLAWWRERLEGVPVLELPTDRPRPVLPQAVAGQRPLVLPLALTRKLRELGQRRGATLFMTLLAAFQALLYRSTGQDDIAVGSPIANRNRGEIEPLIGFFVNMLVLRTGLSGDPGFVELLEQVRQTALGAYAHQDLPFEKLVEELRPARSLQHTPLFQVSFQLFNVPMSPLDLPGLAVRPFPFAVRATKFDLNLELTDQGDQLGGLLGYDTDLFDGTTAERLLAHLERLLAGAAEHPMARLSELPLLTAAERHQLLLEWSSTPSPLPEGECVLHWIEAQAALSPGARAVVAAGLSLTYAELNARANQVARRLRRLGVGPQVPVGICVERSLELVVGVLGILKAGGAYVPLDPSYPAERLAGMLADAFAGVEPAVVLSQAWLLDRLHGERGDALPSTVQMVALEAGEIAAEEAGDLLETPHPADLAYVIYTSGSTGRPKGVPISHRALARSTAARFAVYREPVATFLLLPSFAFDSSVAVLFWTLCQGGTLVLPAEGQERDPRSLLDLVARHHVSHWLSVPSLYAAVLETAGDGALAPLRTVVVAGEACPGELVAQHRQKAAAAALYNEYGPTEAAVWSTVFAFPAEPAHGPVPIGRAVPGARVYVLDRDGMPVPARGAGELCIGGAALAWGYLGRPELTAERFVPDPVGALAGEPGARLYRTGDLVRHQTGGDLEFLGRVDDQVKIRGFRIEPGEIEAALAAHPAVREAAVAVREDGAGERHLVAWFAPRGAEAVPAAELRAFLRERLPAHMVPVLLVALESLPLTPNGKLDRQALPVPDWTSQIPYVAPRTAVEEALAAIWGETLKRERIGIHDNFFDLGGHSLLATRVVSRIQADLQIEVPLREMFESRTLADLAAAVEARSQAGSGDLQKISETLAQLEQLSEEQVQALLREVGLR